MPARLLKEFRRRDHAALARHLDKPEVQTILGARRVGKTTMLYQLAADLVSSGTDPRRILFLSLEEQGVAPSAESLRRVLEAYARGVLGESIYGLTERVYAIVDEVHLVRGWQSVAKHFYDQAWPVKFVVSGSPAADILAGSPESLVGRVWHQTLPAMSFAEFVAFRSPGIAGAVESDGSAMRSGLARSSREGAALPFYESARRASSALPCTGSRAPRPCRVHAVRGPSGGGGAMCRKCRVVEVPGNPCRRAHCRPSRRGRARAQRASGRHGAPACARLFEAAPFRPQGGSGGRARQDCMAAAEGSKPVRSPPMLPIPAPGVGRPAGLPRDDDRRRAG